MLSARLFHRISREELQRGFSRLGIGRGEALLALVSMKSLGYVVGGAESVVKALAEVLGSAGSLMMPSFPSLDPLPAVPPDATFDEAATPSAAGLVSEAFRRRPGTLRSLHPIGAMAAAGPLARSWIEGHEESASPFGPGTPLDRFVASRGRILLVGTHAGPILPYLQERAAFPHLYLPGQRHVQVRSRDGASRRVATRVFRSGSCQVVILQGERPERRDYARMRDYALVFPSDRVKWLEKGGAVRHNLGRLLGRLERLKQRGVIKVGKIGCADAALLEAGAFCDQVGGDLQWEVARFKDEYDPELLQSLDLP